MSDPTTEGVRSADRGETAGDRGGTANDRTTSDAAGGESDEVRRTDGSSGAVALDVRDLTKTYGSGEDAVRAVDGVSFAVDRGTVVGLLGPNGAGKTTTIKMLLGLIVPDGGRVRVDGVDVTESPRAAYDSVSAMLEGARNVYWRLTVRENLRFFARLGDRPADSARIDDLIAQVGLADRADVTVNELSRGMKQKTSLACTLVRETPVAFLDEPTLGLDVESSRDLRRELRRIVEEESRTVILSSHDMDVIEAVCDRVIVLNDGAIVADDTVENLKDVFRTQAYRVTLEGRLDADRREGLARRFGADGWVEDGDRLRFDANRVRGEEFHELLDVVRDSSATLVGVDSLEPDLEDIFLELTGREGTVGRSGNGSGSGSGEIDGSEIGGDAIDAGETGNGAIDDGSIGDRAIDDDAPIGDRAIDDDAPIDDDAIGAGGDRR